MRHTYDEAQKTLTWHPLRRSYDVQEHESCSKPTATFLISFEIPEDACHLLNRWKTPILPEEGRIETLTLS